MEVLCLGLSHKTAPVEMRERFAVGEAHLGEFSSLLAQAPGLREAVVVSTCNRVEYYVAAEDGGRGIADGFGFHRGEERTPAGGSDLSWN